MKIKDEVIAIIDRELVLGTFDAVCSANELQLLRTFMCENQLNTKWQDFGMANSWPETPELVRRCAERKHSPKKIGIGRCLTRIQCDLCHYTYEIDSSD